jgi:hypothetical protein
MMVGLVLYAYAIGERSSRRIERRCAEDVAFRVICANRAPAVAPSFGTETTSPADSGVCATAPERGFPVMRAAGFEPATSRV